VLFEVVYFFVFFSHKCRCDTVMLFLIVQITPVDETDNFCCIEVLNYVLIQIKAVLSPSLISCIVNNVRHKELNAHCRNVVCFDL